MWLTCSSVGRKFVMAVSGAVLLLFVTFHCCMNSIAICWPASYNTLCEFLGANWYALIASVGLALFILLHIVYACWLTLQNRKARGPVGYAISKKPKAVEWSSKNMLVLGIVILAFLVVHLIQFWAKMQLQEIRGVHDILPPAAGTLFLQEAFQTNWTWIVYIAGFIALWFHLNHGIWSMFQSVGWDNKIWIERLKKIAVWWSSIVCLVFVAQAIVFTAKAHEGYFKNDPSLREQYKDMLVPMINKDFGPDALQYGVVDPAMLNYDDFSRLVNFILHDNAQLPQSIEDPQIAAQLMQIQDPAEKERLITLINNKIQALEELRAARRLLDYLEGVDPNQAPQAAMPQPAQMAAPEAAPEAGIPTPEELLGLPEEAPAPEAAPEAPQPENTETQNNNQ